VINKIDLIREEERRARIDAFVRGYRQRTGAEPARVFTISALTGQGCRELTFAIADFLDQAARAEHEDAAAAGTAL
jgi:GTP-binding protein